MAGTITPNLTTISICDALTGWTAVGGTNSLNDLAIFDQKQGTNCIQNYNAAAANRGSDYDFGADTNLSDTTIYCWFAFSKVPHATNPMRIRVEDASANWREWNIFTKATLPHLSWIAWALKTTVAYDAQSATAPVMTAIRKVGWRLDATIAKVYIYFDAWRYGTGLSIKAGTEASPAVLEDFYTADNDSANAYGIVEKYGGIYYSQGQLTIGSTTAGDVTYFKDINQILVFKSIKGNPTGFYEIKGQGNATATTKIFLGTKSGTAGISGCVIKAGTEKFKLTVSDTNITEFGFYSCTFTNADTITGQAYSALKEFLSSTFSACAEMLPDTGIVKECYFISSAAKAIKISSASHNVKNCNFIDCQTAIHHNVGGPVGTPLEYDYDKLIFTGGTYHIENSAVTPNFYINIDRLNGSNPDAAKINNSNGGSTTILAISVQLTLTGLIAGSDVRIMNAGTTTVLAETDNSGTTFVYSYNYGVYPNVDIVVLHLDYEYFRMESFTPASTNASMPIPLRKDRWYSNP